MDRPLTDRRLDARFTDSHIITARATLRPGHLVVLVDVSAGGARVQAARPLRPGARVHLQVATPSRTWALAAHVLRCAVWALHADQGVTYQAALKFDQRCEWEEVANGRLSGELHPDAHHIR